MTQPSDLPFQIPENYVFSKEPNKFWNQFVEFYQKIAKASNGKDIGIYENIEMQNGQTYFGATPQVKSACFRKVVEFGALPNIALKQVAHGIPGIGNGWMFTRVYGMAREPAGVAPRPFYIPIPNVGQYQADLMVDTTNINITTGVNLSMFTRTIIVLEYYKA